MLYGRAWFERDPDRRIEALRTSCAEDVRYMDPNVGGIQGLEALADMIGSSIHAPMEGHEAEAREEHARGMSGSGVSVEVVTPIESFHQFYRYSYIWHFPDGSSSGGHLVLRAGGGRTDPPHHRLAGSDHFAIPPSTRG